MAVYAFDRDGTLEPFGGPVPFSKVLELQRQGHKVGTAGGAPPEEQRQQWQSHGVEPDFALSKGEMEKLARVYPDQEIIQIDDNPGQIDLSQIGRRLITPREFMGLPLDEATIQDYHLALEELGGHDLKAVAAALFCVRTVYIAGNGGSAATAIHLAADLRKVGLQAISLCDNVALVTALANDNGYESIFSAQLNHIDTQDALILISVSGNSSNLVRAAERACRKGATVIAFLGFGGGLLIGWADIAVVLSSRDYGVVEGVHSCLCHIVPQMVRRRG